MQCLPPGQRRPSEDGWGWVSESPGGARAATPAILHATQSRRRHRQTRCDQSQAKHAATQRWTGMRLGVALHAQECLTSWPRVPWSAHAPAGVVPKDDHMVRRFVKRATSFMPDVELLLACADTVAAGRRGHHARITHDCGRDHVGRAGRRPAGQGYLRRLRQPGGMLAALLSEQGLGAHIQAIEEDVADMATLSALSRGRPAR